MSAQVDEDHAQRLAEAAVAGSTDLEQLVQQFDVETEDDLAVAGAVLQQVKAQREAIEAERDGVLEPLKAVQKRVQGWFKPALDTLKRCDEHLRSGAVALLEQAEQRQQELLRSVADSEDPQLTLDTLADPLELPPGLQKRSTWKVLVDDPQQVPRQFLAVDEKALRAHLKAELARTSVLPTVPGVRFVQKLGLAVYAKDATPGGNGGPRRS